MKIIVTENKIESVMIRYLQDIAKVNFEPGNHDGRYLQYFDANGDLFMEIDTWTSTNRDCKIKYRYYVKMYELLSMEAGKYHELLKSVLEKITGYDIHNIIPSIYL
jgi:hypothetical protein